VILIAGFLFGILGMIIAVPFYTILKVIGKEFFPENIVIQLLTKKHLALDSPLLQQPIQKFIKDNLDAVVAQLALQKNPFPEISWNLILEQNCLQTKSKRQIA